MWLPITNRQKFPPPLVHEHACQTHQEIARVEGAQGRARHAAAIRRRGRLRYDLRITVSQPSNMNRIPPLPRAQCKIDADHHFNNKQNGKE